MHVPVIINFRGRKLSRLQSQPRKLTPQEHCPSYNIINTSPFVRNSSLQSRTPCSWLFLCYTALDFRGCTVPLYYLGSRNLAAKYSAVKFLCGFIFSLIWLLNKIGIGQIFIYICKYNRNYMARLFIRRRNYFTSSIFVVEGDCQKFFTTKKGKTIIIPQLKQFCGLWPLQNIGKSKAHMKNYWLYSTLQGCHDRLA